MKTERRILIADKWSKHGAMRALQNRGDLQPISIRHKGRSCGNVGQPKHILANPLMRYQSEWWPGSCEVGCAVTEYDRVKVNPVFVDQTKVSEASRQVWTGNLDLPVALGLQPADRAFQIVPDKPCIGADRLQSARNDPCFRQAAAKALPSGSQSAWSSSQYRMISYMLRP